MSRNILARAHGIGLDLSSGGSFARALAAYYFTKAPTDGSSAFLVSASSGVRRLEDRGDGLGRSLLMEKSSTNVLLWSRDPTHAGWSAGTATQTANANGGVDASGVAARINAGSGQYSAFQTTSLATTPIAGSLWVRGVSSTQSHQLDVYGNGGGVNHASVLSAPSTSYARNDKSGVAAGMGGGMFPVEAQDLTGSGGQAATAQDVYVDMMQIEAGYYPTSPIPTTTVAETRPADTLSYASGAYPADFISKGIVVDFAPDASSAEIASSGETWVLVGADQFGIDLLDSYLSIGSDGAGHAAIALISKGTTIANMTGVVFSRAQHLTITMRPAAGTLKISGATSGNGLAAGPAVAWDSATTLYVGGDHAGANNATGRFVGARLRTASTGSLPTISGSPTIGGTLTITGSGPFVLLRGNVDAGSVTTPYTYVAADVGPSITVANEFGRSNAVQFALPTANIAGDWDSYTAGHYHLTSGLVDTAYDQSGAGNDLTQSNAAHRPAISSGGAPDGSHDAFNFALLAGASVSLRKNAMGLGSAITVYSVTQVPPNQGYVSGGANADTRDTFTATGPILYLYAGSNACGVTPVTVGAWIVDAAVYNGASSAHSINGGTQVTGNPGAGTDAGHVFGGQFADAAANCLQEKAVRQIVYNTAHSAAQVADISAYLKWWSGI